METIFCDPLYEPSRQDSSDEGSQHVFSQNSQKISQIIIKYSLLYSALRWTQDKAVAFLASMAYTCIKFSGVAQFNNNMQKD